MNSLSPLTSAFRRYVRHTRQARRIRHDLALELRHYTTVGDRRELQSIMRRHTSEETAELRDILSL